MEFSELSNKNHCGNEATSGCMTLDEVRAVLRAESLCCAEGLSEKVYSACGCDLMSDVLSFTTPGSILLTGLTNTQVVRTAEILDLKCVVFVRDKKPDAETIAMAVDFGIPLLSSPYPLYESCGLLYANGLKGCMTVEQD